MADVVAIEQVGMPTKFDQALLDEVGDGRLTGARQPREPEHRGLLLLLARPRLAVDAERLPTDIACAMQREVQQAESRRALCRPIDQYETTELAVSGMRGERDEAIEGQLADPDIIELEPLGREPLIGTRVDAVLERVHAGARALRAELEIVLTTGQQRLVIHPHQRRLELVGHLERCPSTDQQIPTPDIDLAVGHHRHRLTGDGLGHIAVERDEPRYPGLGSRALDAQAIARSQPTARKTASVAAEIRIRPDDILDRQAGTVLRIGQRQRHTLQPLQKTRSAIPRHAQTTHRDTLALHR